MDVYGIVWLSVDVYGCMDVYGCLWMFMVAWMCNGCIYIYICVCVYWVSGICPAPAPEGPERGDGRYVFICMDV